MKTQEELKLEFDKLCERDARTLYAPGQVFLLTHLLGTDGKTRYGGYKWVKTKDLEGRKYHFEKWDGQVSIFWDDVLHDCKTHGEVPIERAATT